MKKIDAESRAMKRSYRREDLGPIVRGKYLKAAEKAKNVVVLRPEIARVFRNSRAVNDALASLIVVARQAKAAHKRS